MYLFNKRSSRSLTHRLSFIKSELPVDALLVCRDGVVPIGLLPGDRAPLAQRTKVAGEPRLDASGRGSSGRLGQA